MPHKSADEYMKNRIRLTPETLTYKYTGLLFGWPLLIAVTLALTWLGAALALREQIYDTDTIIAWRNVFYAVTVISGILAVVFNLGDIGNGALCTVGRIVMPLADALYIGKRLRRLAHRRARQDPRAVYQAYRERERQREAEARERKEREATEGPYYSLPWNRKADPFMLRRCVEVAIMIGWLAFNWLIVAFVWNLGPFILVAVLTGLVTILTIQSMIIIATVLLTTKPEDDIFKTADRLIALFRRTRR